MCPGRALYAVISQYLSATGSDFSLSSGIVPTGDLFSPIIFAFLLGTTAHSCFYSKGQCSCTVSIEPLALIFLQLVYSPKQTQIICSGLLLLAMRDIIHTQGSNNTAYGITRFAVFRGNNEHTIYRITHTPSLISLTPVFLFFFSTLPYSKC